MLLLISWQARGNYLDVFNLLRFQLTMASTLNFFATHNHTNGALILFHRLVNMNRLLSFQNKFLPSHLSFSSTRTLVLWGGQTLRGRPPTPSLCNGLVNLLAASSYSVAIENHLKPHLQSEEEFESRDDVALSLVRQKPLEKMDWMTVDTNRSLDLRLKAVMGWMCGSWNCRLCYHKLVCYSRSSTVCDEILRYELIDI